MAKEDHDVKHLHDLTLDGQLKIDRRCDEFESAWRTHQGPSLEDYLDEFAEPDRSILFRELLAIELRSRLDAGRLRASDYCARFPTWKQQIDAAFHEVSGEAAQFSTLDTKKAVDGETLYYNVGTHERLEHSVSADRRRVGDYELLGELARGGMGVVYKARSVRLNRVVALKMMLAAEDADVEQLERFRREAETAANLQHPQIVSIFEVGQSEGRSFIAMELVDGESLAQSTRDGPVAPERAARYVMQAAEAIHYAHEQGVLHRDLKPSNILVDHNDQVHITDFGLAKRVGSDVNLTYTGQVLGTPSYMPPEQTLGDSGNLGVHVDIYALGAVLYCLLTGHPPFQGANVVDTLLMVRTQEPVSPSRVVSGIDIDLETICLTCLSKQSTDRYATAEQLRLDLQKYLEGRAILAQPIGNLRRLWRRCKQNPQVTAAAVALLLAVAIVAADSLIDVIALAALLVILAVFTSFGDGII